MIVSQNFQAANQNSGRIVLSFSHDIEAVVHPIDEIDIRESGRAEHDFRACRSAFGCMAGFILRPDIGFDVNDS